MSIEIASERSVIVTLNESISEKSITQLQALTYRIKQDLGALIIDLIPSYQSILVIFDPLLTDHVEISHRLFSLTDEQGATAQNGQSSLIRLPVYYSPQTGPDLERIATFNHCSIEDVITLHYMNVYRVYAIGFAPGFAYLGEVDEKIATPRLPTPRANVAKGAVGIADRQTAIYPAQSPGGWNIVGRCPCSLFDLDATPAMPFKVGDRVQFIPISAKEFIKLGGQL